jgi:hypothetical protein
VPSSLIDTGFDPLFGGGAELLLIDHFNEVMGEPHGERSTLEVFILPRQIFKLIP